MTSQQNAARILRDLADNIEEGTFLLQELGQHVETAPATDASSGWSPPLGMRTVIVRVLDTALMRASAADREVSFSHGASCPFCRCDRHMTFQTT